MRVASGIWQVQAAAPLVAACPSAATAPFGPADVPGPELPGVPPKHPALPSPVPSLARLEQLAAAAPAEHRFAPGSHP